MFLPLLCCVLHLFDFSVSDPDIHVPGFCVGSTWWSPSCRVRWLGVPCLQHPVWFRIWLRRRWGRVDPASAPFRILLLPNEGVASHDGMEHRDTARWTLNLGTCLSFYSFRYNKRTKTAWIVKTKPWYWRFDKFLIWTLYAVGYVGHGSRYFSLKVFNKFVTPDCAFVSTKWRRSLALLLLSSISIFHLRWRRKEFVELSRSQMQHLWLFDNDPFLGRISFCTCFFSSNLTNNNKILSSLVVGVSSVRLINDGSLWSSSC